VSTTAIEQLLRTIAPANVTAFFLVLARVAPLFVLAPMFSSSMVPMRVRTVIAVALALGLEPVAAAGRHLPSAPLDVAGLVLEQLLVGGALAFAVMAAFAAVQTGGTLLDAVAGFSFGAQLNPLTNSQDAVLSRLYALVGTAIFIAVGGDAWVLRGLASTFTIVPLGAGVSLPSVTSGALSAFSGIFVAAVEVAAPVMMAVLVTDIAFGMVSRVVPQLNVFAVGFPVKIGVAVIMVTASLPFLGGWFEGQLANSVGAALHGIGG
jgi:flagellar biosynthetic protein FliR